MISSRSLRASTAFSSHASASRRIRRAGHNRLFCSTNGCASFMQLDARTGIATCPVCGLQRQIH
jgi:hypothetical protein